MSARVETRFWVQEQDRMTGEWLKSEKQTEPLRRGELQATMTDLNLRYPSVHFRVVRL
jgi:hypothetical protein